MQQTQRHYNKEHKQSWKGVLLKCTQCPETFIQSFLLSEHVQHQHQKERLKVVCSFCGKTCANQPSLRQHEKFSCFSNPQTAALVKCQFCQKEFRRLREHMIEMHPEEIGKAKPNKNHTCNVCGKSFVSAWKVKEHMATHNDKPDPRYQCHICDKFLKQENSFRKHMVNTHGLGHACDVDGCDKKYYSEDYLKIHKRDFHKLV